MRPVLTQAVRLVFFSLLAFAIVAVSVVAQSRPDSTSRRVNQFESPIDPSRYLVLPGQAISVVFLQSSLPSLDFEVNAEGAIASPIFGRIEVGGGTISLKTFRERFIQHLRQIYKSSLIDVTVTSPMEVTVELRGLVQRPGRYRLSNALRLSDLIDTAGGAIQGGSLRQIQVVGVDTQSVDLLCARIRGDETHNPFLYSIKSVEVRPRRQWLRIEGDVRTPQSVEFLANESVNDLLPYAGGTIGESIISVTVNDSLLSAPYVLVGVTSAAVVTVFTQEGRSVVVTGAVSRSARALLAGQSVAQALASASGMNSAADPNRLVIWRRGSGTQESSVNAYPLVILSQFFETQTLEAGDSVVVLPRRGYLEIDIENRVRTVPFTNKLTVRELLALAEEGRLLAAELDFSIRDGATELASTASLLSLLYDGDRLIVRQKARRL